MTEDIAHSRIEKDKTHIQSVFDHLKQVAALAAKNAKKIGLTKSGELIGLLHDFGKYSQVFQNYIGSATGFIDQDEDEYVNAGKLKGKIDHSTAGAKYIWNVAKKLGQDKEVVFQMLSLSIASHHSGLMDCLTVDGENAFEKRMNKPEDKCHLNEITRKADSELLKRAEELLSNAEIVNEVVGLIGRILKSTGKNEILIKFHAGLAARMLLSCLIDADRTDTANFEKPKLARIRQESGCANWKVLINRLEKKLLEFESCPNRNPIDNIRQQISSACMARANDGTGVFTLTVPTGGGKTLASLRFALHHANKHQLDRIIYVIPFTSIIEQNARAVRDILELEKSEHGKIVLEHHSNLLPELQNWKTKILSENWDAPIIFTTSVQL